MSERLLPAPLDDNFPTLESGQTEFVLDDGSIVLPRYFVATISVSADGDSILVPLSVLTYTTRKALQFHDELIRIYPRAALLWVHQLFDAGREEDRDAIQTHRERAAVERADGAQ